MTNKKKTIELDPEQITLEAEAAYHWLQPGTRAAVQVLRDWVNQTQALPEELQPPTWPEIQEALAELAPVSARARELATAKREADKAARDAQAAWARGKGSLNALAEARTRADSLADVNARTVWAANPDAAVAPIKRIGDKLITEWLEPQLQRYWENIQATFTPELAATLRFGMLTVEDMAVTQNVLGAFPQVQEWHTAIRNLQTQADLLRQNGFVSVAEDVEGLDKSLVQNEARYNWQAGVQAMITRFGKLIDEGNPAEWLAAALVHGKGPALLTGEQVDARGDEAIREVTGRDRALAAPDRRGPASGGTVIVHHGPQPLFYND